MSAVDELPQGVRLERFALPGAASATYRADRPRGVLGVTCHAPHYGTALLALGAGSLAIGLADLGPSLESLLRLLFAAGALYAFVRSMTAHVRVELEDGILVVVGSVGSRDAARWDAAELDAVRRAGGRVIADQAGRAHVLVDGLSPEQAGYLVKTLRAALGLERSKKPRVRVERAHLPEREDARRRASRAERKSR